MNLFLAGVGFGVVIGLALPLDHLEWWLAEMHRRRRQMRRRGFVEMRRPAR